MEINMETCMEITLHPLSIIIMVYSTVYLLLPTSMLHRELCIAISWKSARIS